VFSRLNIPRSIRVEADRLWLRGLVNRAHDWLGSRRIIDLSPAELERFRAEIRAYMIEKEKGFAAVRLTAKQTARTLVGATGSPVTASRVDLTEGSWYFFHTDASNPVVVSEMFVPYAVASQAVLPKRPAFPSGAARGGRNSGSGAPRWLDSGVIGAKPPALSASPPRVLSGLPGAAMTEGPALVVDQLTRAELRQLSRSWIPFTNKEVHFIGVPEQRLKRTLGLGIDSIEYLPVAAGGGTTFDLRVRVKGWLGMEAVRTGDENVLPLPEALGLDELGLVGYQRLHLWGPILGDSTTAGIAYGSNDFNRVQLASIEKYLKAGHRGNTSAVHLEATAFIKLRKIGDDTYPFVHEVSYEYTVDGKRYRYRVHTDHGVPAIEAPPGIR
jgi:hypothetical protein